MVRSLLCIFLSHSLKRAFFSYLFLSIPLFKPSPSSAVLLDTKGPEIRTGFFEEGIDKLTLEKGQNLVLTSDYNFRGNPQKLACSYPQLAASVSKGQQILVADGSLVLTVLDTMESHGEVLCRVENNATIGERKNMNLPGVKVDLPTFTEKDKEDIIEFGIKRKVEFIAASFVRKAEDVRNLKKLLAENGGSQIKIISKIENLEGLENYDDILKETDGVMVARGDLGMVRCWAVAAKSSLQFSFASAFAHFYPSKIPTAIL